MPRYIMPLRTRVSNGYETLLFPAHLFSPSPPQVPASIPRQNSALLYEKYYRTRPVTHPRAMRDPSSISTPYAPIPKHINTRPAYTPPTHRSDRTQHSSRTALACLLFFTNTPRSDPPRSFLVHSLAIYASTALTSLCRLPAHTHQLYSNTLWARCTRLPFYTLLESCFGTHAQFPDVPPHCVLHTKRIGRSF